MLPTAPAAPDTTIISPDFGLHIFKKPRYAVAPGIPNTPRPNDIGRSPNDEGKMYGSISGNGSLLTFNGLWIVCVRQPKCPYMMVPVGNFSDLLLVTLCGIIDINCKKKTICTER